jgi:hypothetical protein
MLRAILLTSLLLCSIFIYAQDFASIQSNLSNYAKRVYFIEKFNGVKIIETDNDKYLIIAVMLEKKNNSQQTLNTIANIKAKAYLSSFQNGSYILTETIVVASNNDSLLKHPVSAEILKEYSSGFVKGLSILTNFEDVDPKNVVYIFYTKI